MMPAIRTIRTLYADLAVCDRGGSGQAVLLLHGSGFSQDIFARQFASPALEALRLVSIDLPGHGQSDNARDLEGYTLPALAGAVGAVLDALRIDRAVVYGWSLGGHVAIELLSQRPRVSGLMLTGTPPVSKGPLGLLRGFRPSWDMFLGSKSQFSTGDARRFVLMSLGVTGTEEQVETILRADGRLRTVFMRSMMRGDGADQRRTVETAKIPIAIVNGTDEPVVRQGYLDSLSIPHLWGHECMVLPNCGHAPFWQQADSFNALLAGFVDDVARFRLPEPARLARWA
jgi:pimeloyl-ACP methyl ester carboxylesterase